MEERVMPHDGNKDDPPLKPSSGDKEPPPPPPPPPGMTLVKSNETYVIQVPRDQVYRIPPPENANIVENYRKPSNNDGKKACGGRWMFIFLIVLVVIGYGIFVTVNHMSNPKLPEFSIAHFARKASHAPSHNKNSEYEVSLHVFNPNEKMSVHYGDGNMTLYFKRRKIAHGASKLDQQGGGTTVEVDQSLHATKGKLPEEVRKIMDNKHPKVLILKIDVPIEVKTWEKTFKKVMIVGCKLEVDSLAPKSKLLSQNCGAN